MLTNDELEVEFYARSISLQKAFIQKVSPRGSTPVSRDEADEQTWTYLEQLTTIEGELYDEFLMNLTLEDLKAVRQHPTPEDLAEFERGLKKPRRELTDKDLDRVAAGPPQHTLSLLAWLWTTQGWAVWTREGKEKLFEWAIQQTDKLIKLKELELGGLSQEVRHRLGREKDQKHNPGGDLLTYIRDAGGEFFMAGSFTWNQIPSFLRQKRGRFGGDSKTFDRRQHAYLNHIEIDQPQNPKYWAEYHPSYLLFVPISK